MIERWSGDGKIGRQGAGDPGSPPPVKFLLDSESNSIARLFFIGTIPQKLDLNGRRCMLQYATYRRSQMKISLLTDVPKHNIVPKIEPAIHASSMGFPQPVNMILEEG